MLESSHIPRPYLGLFGLLVSPEMIHTSLDERGQWQDDIGVAAQVIHRVKDYEKNPDHLCDYRHS